MGDAAVFARRQGRQDVWPRRLRHEVRHHRCALALDAIKAAGLKPTARVIQSVIEEESTGVGALSTLQRGYRADCCFIPEPTRQHGPSQVGVIWFRLKVRGFPVHVFEAGSGSNAITAAYHLIQSLEKLETEWNARAKSDRHFRELTHPINFNPGIIKGGDWASSVPAWCDVDCRIAILPGWSVTDCQAEILACVSGAARDHRFLSNNPPSVEWSGFLSEGYELKDSAERKPPSARPMARSMAARFPISSSRRSPTPGSTD